MTGLPSSARRQRDGDSELRRSVHRPVAKRGRPRRNRALHRPDGTRAGSRRRFPSGQPPGRTADRWSPDSRGRVWRGKTGAFAILRRHTRAEGQVSSPWLEKTGKIPALPQSPMNTTAGAVELVRLPAASTELTVAPRSHASLNTLSRAASLTANRWPRPFVPLRPTPAPGRAHRC